MKEYFTRTYELNCLTLLAVDSEGSLGLVFSLHF